MKYVKEISLAAKEWQIKGTDNENFVEFEKEIKNNSKEIKAMRKENSYLTERLEDMDAVLGRQEQYSRRNCLLIHGVDEVEN